jgi:hypothetical protein
MNKSPAWIVALILLIQITSLSLEETPTTIEFDEPSFEDTSPAYGRNNSSGNNSGCGYDINNTMLMAYASMYMYYPGIFNSWISTHCDLVNVSMMVNMSINNTTGTVDYGNITWTGTSNSTSDMWNVSGLTIGNYTFIAQLWYQDNSSNWQHIETDSTNFSVLLNNTGGNNTGGNNTGGNNTGGNNTGGNNTGGNNNSNCENNSNLTDLMVWTDLATYIVGDSVSGGFFVNCTVIGESYQLDYEVVEYNTNTNQANGEWNWTALNNWESFNPTWTGLPAGAYCIHSTLVIWTGAAYSFVDFESPCFDILNSTTGGNNTGGNNTGGNNTGGNNTGGNNTGGNNTACPGLSPSGIDGFIGIENVSLTYAQGDMVDAWVDLCWSPYLGNTSIWYTVWLNNSNGFTIQNWGLQGSTWFPSWVQGIDYGGGHWEFPLRHLPVSGSWNLSIDSLAPGETYCFEGNLKVFDTLIGAFIWVDDATPMCFSVPQNNNTGGNNTGGNNTGGNNTGGNNTGGNNTGGNNTGGTNSTANTAPQISSVVISPSPSLETDVLTCSYMFNDADNDPDASIFVWTINGITITSVNSVLSSGYIAGDFVTCAVLAYDGIDYGNMGTSTVLIMSNTTISSSNSSGSGIPSVGVVGTLAVIGLSFIAVIRRGRED